MGKQSVEMTFPKGLWKGAHGAGPGVSDPAGAPSSKPGRGAMDRSALTPSTLAEVLVLRNSFML